jgi:hypothetical protein
LYDGLTGHYRFSCPKAGESRVRLSRFRALERLPGPSHPVVYKIAFDCGCGTEHEGLVTHDELDWAPLAGGDVSFFNLMTQRFEAAELELVERAAQRIRAGEWPWSFFCYPENRSQPVFPSAFRALAPADERVGVAVRCPACARLSLNVVSARHVDEPFYSDTRVGVIEHVFAQDAETCVEEFRAELESAAFDARRRAL